MNKDDQIVFPFSHGYIPHTSAAFGQVLDLRGDPIPGEEFSETFITSSELQKVVGEDQEGNDCHQKEISLFQNG